MNTKVMFSSKTDDWATPEVVFREIERLHGPFTLDPCATKENTKCIKYYTLEDDGLAQNWSGHRVFLNPPYGREIGEWIKKAYESDTYVVMLIPARTDTAYWHDYCMKGEIEFIRGRIKFGTGSSSAPFPSALVIFKPRRKLCKFSSLQMILVAGMAQLKTWLRP